MNYLQVVVKRSQYSKSQYLTSSYHEAGGDPEAVLVWSLDTNEVHEVAMAIYGSKRLAIINSKMQC